MWNYNYVLPSLLVLVIILFYYFSRPRLPLRLNKTFLGILLLDIFTIITDYLSSRACERYAELSVATVNVLNMAFFICFLTRIYWFYLFSVDALKIYYAKPRWKGVVSGVPILFAEAVALSSFFSGAVFTVDAAGYHRGPWYFLLPACSFLYIFQAFVLIIRNRKRLSPFEIGSLMGYNTILAIGNLVRILMPKYLIMNTFCLLAILVIYLSFENPDLYTSDRGTAFNMRAFQDKLNEIGQKKPYRILGMVLRDYNDERGIYGGAQMDQGIALISQYLYKQYPECLVFYLRSGCFTLLGPENLDCGRIRGEIEERFEKPWKASDADLYLTPAFVEVGAEVSKESVDRVVNTLLIALDSAGKADESHAGQEHSDIIQAIDQQMEIKRSLEHALETDGVEVFLQPLYDVKNKRIIAAEALARIRDMNGKLIPPNLFIPIAEKNGHINLLGEQVFRKTCRFIRDHVIEDLGLAWVNVNLSPIQCMRSDLPQRFSAILREYGVPADMIHLEITEASIIDYSLLQKQVMSLRKEGFQFALDDYGSGYSNLTRVKHYPFINVKLDMEVVWDYFRERDTLLPTLVQAFRQMDVTITAEGIETAEMAEALAAIGCDYLQGYYYSRPIPMDDFVAKYGKKAVS